MWLATARNNPPVAYHCCYRRPYLAVLTSYKSGMKIFARSQKPFLTKTEENNRNGDAFNLSKGGNLQLDAGRRVKCKRALHHIRTPENLSEELYTCGSKLQTATKKNGPIIGELQTGRGSFFIANIYCKTSSIAIDCMSSV